MNGSAYSTPRNKSKLSQATVVPSSPDSSDDNGGYDGGTFNDYGNDYGDTGGRDDNFQYDQLDDQPPEEASPQEARTSFSVMNHDTSDVPAPEEPPGSSSPPRRKQNGKSKVSVAEEEVGVEEDISQEFEDGDQMEMEIDEGVEMEDDMPQMSRKRATDERQKPKKAPAKRKKVHMAEAIMDQGKTTHFFKSGGLSYFIRISTRRRQAK